MSLGGGYCKPIEATVQAHADVFVDMLEVFGPNYQVSTAHADSGRAPQSENKGSDGVLSVFDVGEGISGDGEDDGDGDGD